MPDGCFRMLNLRPIRLRNDELIASYDNANLLQFGKYAKYLEQSKYVYLMKTFKPISKEVGYGYGSEMHDNQKLIIFDV